MKLIMLPGDGIGPEITAATDAVLRAASERFDLGLVLETHDVGHASLRTHGTTFRPELFDIVRAADGFVLGPTATYDFKDEAKGEVNPSKLLRQRLDLYVNIRPARTYPGHPNKVGAFDLVVVRENTEGFYADRNMAEGNAEIRVTEDVVVSLRRITRLCCMRIAETAFALARARRRHVTAVHKANVLRMGDGLFLECCEAVAARRPDIVFDTMIVDAMMAHVVRNPARFDVIVTTNMFGDILSDLTAELSGSIGLGGSLNAGDAHAMAQAAHGSAPDIAGQDRANPISLVLSAAQLLAWHGERTQSAKLRAAAAAIEASVAAAVAAGEGTRDVGGSLGTAETGRRIAENVKKE